MQLRRTAAICSIMLIQLAFIISASRWRLEISTGRITSILTGSHLRGMSPLVDRILVGMQASAVTSMDGEIPTVISWDMGAVQYRIVQVLLYLCMCVRHDRNGQSTEATSRGGLSPLHDGLQYVWPGRQTGHCQRNCAFDPSSRNNPNISSISCHPVLRLEGHTAGIKLPDKRAAGCSARPFGLSALSAKGLLVGKTQRESVRREDTMREV
ncbi:hypothetical protein V8F20_003560 [Naviculisporaceae sp. PSN 640]